MKENNPGRANLLKWGTLVILVVQTTFMVVTLRYSRISTPDDSPKYVISTAVVLAEILKIGICCGLVYWQCGRDASTFISELRTEFIDRWYDFLKLSVPGGLYVVQNNLLFVALSYLDAATYQVTYQLKILTTAMFSVTMLNKQLTWNKWTALVVLMVGVAFVQWPTESTERVSKSLGLGGQLIGVSAVVAACFSSGFAGVYFEKILKGSEQSVWLRNIQLGVFGVFFGLATVVTVDFSSVVSGGFFQGYRPIVWLVVINQAASGLIVAAVIKYADNILKGFATSVSIISSSLFSYLVLSDFTPTSYFVIGSLLVIGATFLYGYEIKLGKYKAAIKV